MECPIAFLVRDEFSTSALPYHWMMMRNPRETWWKLEAGSLELRARPVALGDNGNPSFLARRQQHINAMATTAVHFVPSKGGEAGIVALQSDEFWYFLAIAEQDGRPVIRLKRRAGPAEPVTGVTLKQMPLPNRGNKALQLRIEAHGALYDFSWSIDGKRWVTLEKARTAPS